MLISVAMPVYNGHFFLIKAVESVLAQDVDLELIISDDGSRDGSQELIAKLTDPRIRVLTNNGNVGIFGNLNRCIAAAGGRYIQIFGQDDVMKPGYLASQVRHLEKHPAAGMVYNQPDYIGDDDLPRCFMTLDAVPELVDTRTYLWFASHYTALPPNISSIMIRREVFERIGHFSTRFRIIGDIEFYNRLSEHYPIVYNKEVLHQVRAHDGQTSSPMKSGPISLREEILLEPWYRSRWSEAEYREIKRFRAAWRGRFHFGWIRRMAFAGRVCEAVGELAQLNRLYPLHLVVRAALAGFLIRNLRHEPTLPPPFSSPGHKSG